MVGASMKPQSRAASGLSTSWPGADVISRWNTLIANMVDAWSVAAAGSVTVTRSVDTTVNGRGVAPGVLGAGGGFDGLLQPASTSAGASASRAARRPRDAQRSDQRIGLVQQPYQAVEVDVGQRGHLDPTRRGRYRHPVGHGHDEGAGGVGRTGPRLAVLEGDAGARVDAEHGAGALVRLRVRLAALDLVACDRGGERPGWQPVQGRIQQHPV